MAIIRRNERTLARPQQEWDPFSVMQDMLRGWDPFRQMAPVPSEQGGGFIPQFDVKETKDGYLFKADLPGVKESDLDISLSGNTLTVSGKRESEKRDEADTWYMYERNYGTFTRTFTLPESADANAVRAEMRDGVLTLMLPKRPEMQPRKIMIGKGSEGGGKEKAKA